MIWPRVVDRRTLAVSITHVSWQTRFRHNLSTVADIAHANGACLIVDAAQSAGALDVDVHRVGVDFMTRLAMKWLLGSPGVGFLFVAREHLERSTPPQVGYAGLERPFELGSPLVFKHGAQRHELGLPNLSGLAAAREGIDILLRVGLQRVEQHVLELSGYAIEQLRSRGLTPLTPIEPECRAGIVALQVAKSVELVDFMRGRSVDVWTEPNLRLLRIDPHLFNHRSDLDRFLAGLDEFARIHGHSAVEP